MQQTVTSTSALGQCRLQSQHQLHKFSFQQMNGRNASTVPKIDHQVCLAGVNYMKYLLWIMHSFVRLCSRRLILERKMLGIKLKKRAQWSRKQKFDEEFLITMKSIKIFFLKIVWYHWIRWCIILYCVFAF